MAKQFNAEDYRDKPLFHGDRQLLWSVYFLSFDSEVHSLPGIGPFDTQLEAAEKREELRKVGITSGLILNPAGYRKE